MCFLVARHTFQAAAPDRGGGEWAPVQSVAHVHEGFQIAGGRCPWGCGDKHTSVPSLKSWTLIQRPALTHGKRGVQNGAAKKWGAWEDLNSNLPSTTYCQVSGGKLLPVSSSVDPGLIKAQTHGTCWGTALRPPEHHLTFPISYEICHDQKLRNYFGIIIWNYYYSIILKLRNLFICVHIYGHLLTGVGSRIAGSGSVCAESPNA